MLPLSVRRARFWMIGAKGSTIADERAVREGAGARAGGLAAAKPALSSPPEAFLRRGGDRDGDEGGGVTAFFGRAGGRIGDGGSTCTLWSSRVEVGNVECIRVGAHAKLAGCRCSNRSSGEQAYRDSSTAPAPARSTAD